MSVISEFTQPDTEPGYFVEFLDQLDHHASMRDMRAEVVPRMITTPGCKALDLGCGIGGATFLMSDQAGPTGRVVGVDISAALIDVARHRARMRANLEFHVGDATAIPYTDGFFDTAHSERVFLYLPDRLAALRELRRVVKPGGRIWLVDTDIDSTAIYSNRRESTRKMIATLAAAMPNPNSGRELPTLAKAAGLSDVRVETLAVTTPHAWQVHAMGACWHVPPPAVFSRSPSSRPGRRNRRRCRHAVSSFMRGCSSESAAARERRPKAIQLLHLSRPGRSRRLFGGGSVPRGITPAPTKIHRRATQLD